MTTRDELGGAAPLDGVAAIENWTVGYVNRHPLASLTTVGEQCVLAVRTVQYFFADLLGGRFQWGEFVRQSAFMANTAVLPTVLVAVGSAITADLGSRTMREETDAMEVMGVSVIRRLVVPRFAAAIMIGVALTGITCFVGFLASYLFNVYFQKGAPGSFVATFSSFATTGDMVVALIKAVVYGAIVAVVSCQKGLSTRGGPAGVANSVNASVVESILVLMIVNVGISELYNVLYPRTGL